jgi:hypothetical protein
MAHGRGKARRLTYDGGRAGMVRLSLYPSMSRLFGVNNVHRSPFTVHRSPFTVHRSPFGVRRSGGGRKPFSAPNLRPAPSRDSTAVFVLPRSGPGSSLAKDPRSISHVPTEGGVGVVAAGGQCCRASVLSPKYEVFCCDQNGPPARRSEPDWR